MYRTLFWIKQKLSPPTPADLGWRRATLLRPRYHPLLKGGGAKMYRDIFHLIFVLSCLSLRPPPLRYIYS